MIIIFIEWASAAANIPATLLEAIATLTRHTNIVHGIAVSPNGPILVGALHDNIARLWDLENVQPICSPLQHGIKVSFSADGQLVTSSGCWDKTTYTAWDVSTIVRGANCNHLLLNPEAFRISLYLLKALAGLWPDVSRCTQHIYKSISLTSEPAAHECPSTTTSRIFRPLVSSSSRTHLMSHQVFS